MEARLLETIEKNKIILILTEKEIATELEESLHKEAYHVTLRIRCSEIEFIERNSPDKKPICIVNSFGEDGRFENIFIRYNLNTFEGKIIVTCRHSLLSHYRNPDLYFVPIKNHRLDKRFFAKYEFQLSNKEKIPLIQSTLFLKKENFLKEVKNQSEEKKPKTLREHYLNQKLMTQNTVMMQFLADRVQENEEYKAFLFQLVYASRQDEAMQVAAANAITALNYARVPFSGMNLEGIKIPHANLNCSILDKASFSHADLWNVSFKRAFLGNTDFSFASMLDIQLGESPYIQAGWRTWCSALNLKNGLLATGGEDKKVWLWDINTGKSIHTFENHTNNIYTICFHPSGLVFVSAGLSRSGGAEICVFDIQERKLLYKLTGHTQEIYCVNFSNSGELLAIGSWDKTISLWNVKYEFEKILTEDFHDTAKKSFSCIGSLAFSPDDKILAGSSYGNTIQLWGIENSEILKKLVGHTGNITSIKFNLKGNLLFSASEDKSIRIWNLSTGDVQQILNGHTHIIKSIALALNETLIVSVGWDRTVRVWEINNRNSYVVVEHWGELESVHAGEDNKIIAASREGKIYFWSVSPENYPYAHQTHTNSVNTVDVSLRWQLIASGSWDQTVRLWYSQTGILQRVFITDHKASIGCVKFSPNELLLAFVDRGDGYIRIWNMVAQQFQIVLKQERKDVRAIDFKYDNSLLASAGTDNLIRIWDLKSGELLKEYNADHESIIFGLSFNQDGLLASCDGKGTVTIWDVEKDCLYRKLQGHSDSVYSIKFNKSGDALVSTGGSALTCLSEIFVWNISTGNIIQKLSHVDGTVMSAKFNEKGNLLVSAHGKSCAIWDIYRGEILCNITGHFADVFNASFYGNNAVVSVSNDHAVRFWDLKLIEGELKPFLRWATRAFLFLSNLNLEGAKNLSTENFNLLKQKEAIATKVNLKSLKQSASRIKNKGDEELVGRSRNLLLPLNTNHENSDNISAHSKEAVLHLLQAKRKEYKLEENEHNELVILTPIIPPDFKKFIDESPGQGKEYQFELKRSNPNTLEITLKQSKERLPQEGVRLAKLQDMLESCLREGKLEYHVVIKGDNNEILKLTGDRAVVNAIIDLLLKQGLGKELAFINEHGYFFTGQKTPRTDDGYNQTINCNM